MDYKNIEEHQKLRDEYNAKKIETVKKDPKYWRWLELRAKYEEFEEYMLLKKQWEGEHIVKPPMVEITNEMIQKMSLQINLPRIKCLKALLATNGDIDKAIDRCRYGGLA